MQASPAPLIMGENNTMENTPIIQKNTEKNEHLQIFIALVLVALIVIPMLGLTNYIQPSADDFSNAYERVQSMDGPMNMLRSGMDAMKSFYQWAGGSFFTHFFVGMVPFAFYGVPGIVVYCLVEMILFFFVLFALVRTAIRNIFGERRWSVTLWFYVGILFLITQFANPREFFYWFTGSAAYLLPTMMMMVGMAGAIKMFFEARKPRKIVWMVVASLSFFLVGGSSLNFVCLIFLSVFVIWICLLKTKNKNRGWMGIVFAVMMVGILINITAPGNYSRLGMTEQATSISTAAWKSLQQAMNTAPSQVFSYAVPFAVLCLHPLMVRLCENTGYSFKKPGLVVLLSALVYCAGYFPYMYAYGGIGFPLRYISAMWIFFVMLVFLNTFYVTGWLVKKYNYNVSSIYRKVVLALMAFLSLGLSLSMVPLSQWTSVVIATDYMEGTLAHVQNDTAAVLAQIEFSENPDVVLERLYDEHPYVKSPGLTYDPENWVNVAVASYYGKNSVSVLPPA